ncbi:MAG: calcium/sodium antiporter [Firmicutes bacterium]|nr:calcium/sodium antiporter [Bacillota bacterium]
MAYVYLVIGLALLVRGADYLIDGSTSLAKRLGIPSLIIGLTVVALGTSLPEFIINVISALRGATGVAFGNVVGSNIANTLLILGTASLVNPLRIAHSTVWREIPFNLLAALVLLVISNIPPMQETGPSYIAKADGIVLLFCFVVFLFYLYNSAIKYRTNLVDEKLEIELLTPKKTTIYIVVGIIGLYVGGVWAVNGAVSIARSIGAPEFLISATIVAFGTSLPELITSIRAALRGDSDLVVGNIVGSNILNILFVLGITTIITPVVLPKGINTDLLFLIVSSFLFFAFMFVGQKHTLDRWQGFLFLSGYLAYIVLSIFRSL